jgi:hypothetical protein
MNVVTIAVDGSIGGEIGNARLEQIFRHFILNKSKTTGHSESAVYTLPAITSSPLDILLLEPDITTSGRPRIVIAIST